MIQIQTRQPEHSPFRRQEHCKIPLNLKQRLLSSVKEIGELPSRLWWIVQKLRLATMAASATQEATTAASNNHTPWPLRNASQIETTDSLLPNQAYCSLQTVVRNQWCEKWRGLASDHREPLWRNEMPSARLCRRSLDYSEWHPLPRSSEAASRLDKQGKTKTNSPLVLFILKRDVRKTTYLRHCTILEGEKVRKMGHLVRRTNTASVPQVRAMFTMVCATQFAHCDVTQCKLWTWPRSWLGIDDGEVGV